MMSVGYHSPWVPPEWIAAHGLAPQWLWLAAAPSGNGVRRGQCPFAAAVLSAAIHGEAGAALVLTTACDQMRYVAAALEQERAAVFLLHVPATWQTPTARQLYYDELLRLGRFLEGLGGQRPSSAALWETMQAYQSARAALLARREGLTASQFAAELAGVRSVIRERVARPGASAVSHGIPLALVGGPITAADAAVFDAIEAAGGRIALDASEGGERTFPAPFDPALAARDPLAALVDSHFGAIVDIGRRPVTPLHDWLAGQIDGRAIRGVILRRYVSCDLWLGELQPLRQRLGVPVLDLDCGHVDQPADGRALARIEAFLETLRREPQ